MCFIRLKFASRRPYTLKEYNIIKPKGYMVIESLKPGGRNILLSHFTLFFTNLCIFLYFSLFISDLNTEELIAKRNNLERIKQFSKNLSNYNKEALVSQRKLPSAAEKHDIEVSNKKQESKQARAKEFSRNIPLPKPSTQHLSQAAQTRNNNKHAQEQEDVDDCYGGQRESDSKRYERSFHSSEEAEAEQRLQQLMAKHDQSKAQINSVRKTLGI